MGEVFDALIDLFDPSDLEHLKCSFSAAHSIPICRGVVAVNDIDEWDDESASDYTIVRCANEEREASPSRPGLVFRICDNRNGVPFGDGIPAISAKQCGLVTGFTQ